MTSKTKYIDYLDEDKVIPNQLWVCISFLSPEGIRNCTIRGLKVRGVYATREEADRRAKQLQDIDPDFHVFVGEVGKWLPWDPNPDTIPDQEYANDQLNKLMKGYKDQRRKKEKVEIQRKNDLLREAARREKQKPKSLTRAEKKRQQLRKKLEKRKAKKQNKTGNRKQEQKQGQKQGQEQGQKQGQEQDNIFNKDDKLVKEEKNRLTNNKKAIEHEEQKLNSVDAKINKIKELFGKLKSKESEQ